MLYTRSVILAIRDIASSIACICPRKKLLSLSRRTPTHWSLSTPGWNTEHHDIPDRPQREGLKSVREHQATKQATTTLSITPRSGAHQRFQAFPAPPTPGLLERSEATTIK